MHLLAPLSALSRPIARMGTSPIDLIDGERLCLLLKEHRLGISTELVEEVPVSPDFFQGL
jgi:restriction system protein